MLTAAGTKLLDFGLAKHTVGAAGQALSMLATAPGTGTENTPVGRSDYWLYVRCADCAYMWTLCPNRTRIRPVLIDYPINGFRRSNPR